MKAINFYHSDFPIAEIDIVIDSLIPYSKLKRNAIYVKISEEKLPVINIHDLILIKLETGRKQDLADVESLKKILELESNGQ